MSGSFGSGGLGSFTVYPVEVTCALAGDSTITDSAALLATGDCLFLGDSTSSFEVSLNAAGDVTFTGESLGSFTVISQVMIDAALVADSAFSAIAALADDESVAFVGSSTWVLLDSKVTVTSLSRLRVAPGKPPTVPTIRINPPPVVTPNISIGASTRRSKTDKDPR